MGHEDPFPRPRLNGRCRLRKRSSANNQATAGLWVMLLARMRRCPHDRRRHLPRRELRSVAELLLAAGPRSRASPPACAAGPCRKVLERELSAARTLFRGEIKAAGKPPRGAAVSGRATMAELSGPTRATPR